VAAAGVDGVRDAESGEHGRGHGHRAGQRERALAAGADPPAAMHD
jgi:hypothetical protein